MEAIFSLIRKINRSINLESKQINKNYGMSAPQVLCLQILGDSTDFQAIQKDLAVEMNLNASTMSGIIDRLEKKNMVVCLPKKGDRRVNVISLSTKGYDFLKSHPDLLADKLLTKLNQAPEEEVKKIEDSLNSLIHYLSA